MFITVVPGDSAYIVERFGRYFRTLPPGVHLLLPILDRVAFRYSLRPVREQLSDKAITLDNIPVAIRSTVHWQIVDAREAAYGTADPIEFVKTLVKTKQREWIAAHSSKDARENTRQFEADVVRAAEELARSIGVRVVELTVETIERVTT